MLRDAHIPFATRFLKRRAESTQDVSVGSFDVIQQHRLYAVRHCDEFPNSLNCLSVRNHQLIETVEELSPDFLGTPFLTCGLLGPSRTFRTCLCPSMRAPSMKWRGELTIAASWRLETAWSFYSDLRGALPRKRRPVWTILIRCPRPRGRARSPEHLCLVYGAPKARSFKLHNCQLPTVGGRRTPGSTASTHCAPESGTCAPGSSARRWLMSASRNVARSIPPTAHAPIPAVMRKLPTRKVEETVFFARYSTERG